MRTISVVPYEEQSGEKVTAIEALVTWALVSLPGVVQRFGNNNFHTAAPGPPAPTPKGAPPKTQIRFARNDGTRPSPSGAASTNMTHPSALASVTLEQSAEENAHSPSIQQALVRNSDAPEVDEQPLGARFPVRVVWPLPVSEIPPEAAGTTLVAKNEKRVLGVPEEDHASYSDGHTPSDFLIGPSVNDTEEVAAGDRLGLLV
jgi:hypothetical protein